MANLDMARGQARETSDTKIKLHGPEAFEGMRKAGQLAAEALDMLVDHVTPGVTTEYLDDLIVEFALDRGAIPAPLNYRGFPKAICTSVNHVVCHGIPNTKPLKEGDIINIDVTLILDGWHGDTSRMYPVGHISRRAERLIDVTYEALMLGVAAVTVQRSRPTPSASAAVWYAISAATGWGGCFTTGPTSCTTASPAKARCWSRVCCSPSSR
jgi:methionyl aminopeptidase